MEPPEGEPIGKLEIGDDEYVFHRFNSALYTHTGELAMYDHVFVELPGEGPTGLYLFEMNDSYLQVARYMIENHFPRHMDLAHVEECDKDAFEAALALTVTDLEDGVPEGWE